MGTQWDSMGRNGTQWGRNGDAMGRNGTQWGRNGDAMGRNGDAMGTQWGRGKGGSRAKTEQPQNDPIWGPDVPGDAAAPIPMALKELMPPPPRDKGGDVTATITARGRKGNCMGRGETSAFGYTLTGAGTHGCSSATGRTGMGLLYPWLSPLLSPLLSPRLSPLLSPLPSPRLRTPTAGRDVCSAISAVILPKSSARMPSGPSLRGHRCPPELLGGQRGDSNGVEGTQMGWKGAPGSPAQMCGRTPRLRHHLQQHRGWGAMSPKGFVSTGGRESAATAESAAGRGQQRDGDNSGSAGRRPAALAAFPRRQRPHGRALGFSPTPTPRFPPTAAPAAERRRVVDSRLSPLRTSTDGDRGRHRSSAWGGIRAPGVAHGSGAAPRGLTPLPLRPPGPPSRYSPAAAHSSTRGRAPPPPRRTPSAIAAAAAAALTPRPRCGPAPLR